MHDWFFQIELIESIWQKKAELREGSIKFVPGSPDISVVSQKLMMPKWVDTHCFYFVGTDGADDPFYLLRESFCTNQKSRIQ